MPGAYSIWVAMLGAWPRMADGPALEREGAKVQSLFAFHLRIAMLISGCPIRQSISIGAYLGRMARVLLYRNHYAK